MVKKSTHAEQDTESTRRSTRIKGRSVTGQAASTKATKATAASPIKSTTSSRPVRQVRHKKPVQKTATTVSDRPRRTATNTSRHTTKRKRKGFSEADVKVSTSRVNQPASSVTVGRKRSKKIKFTQVESSASQLDTSSQPSSQPSIATVQETQVASSVVIQDTTVPQVTTTTIPVMKKVKKRGRPRKADSLTSAARQSKKRAIEDDYKSKLQPKRRKGDTFTVPIPIRPQQIGQVYAIGANNCSQCGVSEETESFKKVKRIPSLEQFNIVDISAGSLHNAALTVDGKVVTWGCNDHGTLGRFTDTSKSESRNYNIGEESKPAYAEGLDNVNIVKIVCGGNATFAISDQGHLYATGTFKGKNGIIGFSYDNRIEQPIFTRYTPFEHLTIVDVAAGVDHALALTKEGDVFAWGSNEVHRLGRKLSERRPFGSLVPFNLGLKHIVRLYAGAYHNFAIDKNGTVWVFGFNNMGQCGLSGSKSVIVPPERHSFFDKLGQRVEEFASGEHHTLARMQDGQVFSFGRADYGQLGLGDNVLPPTKDTKARVVTPTVIPNLTSIKSVGTGDHFSMAVDTVNKIYAWGFGSYFVLGNKKEDDVTSPFRMPDLDDPEDKNIVRTSCGSGHALFLMATASGNSVV